MAVTIDDKLKMFQSLLMENINAENEQVITKLSKEYDQELASSQNKINQQADRILRDAEITSKTESNNQIQKSVSERNKQVLFARKQYTEELFSLLREKVTNMPKEKTVHYLKRSLTEIERMFDQNHILLKVEAKDMPIAKELLEQMKQDGTLKKTMNCSQPIWAAWGASWAKTLPPPSAPIFPSVPIWKIKKNGSAAEYKTNCARGWALSLHETQNAKSSMSTVRFACEHANGLSFVKWAPSEAKSHREVIL
jgi:vacuolar-type H+-ATPase subunit E/Vma4